MMFWPYTNPLMRSMVGSPVEGDLTAFPKFKDAIGHYATLKVAFFFKKYIILKVWLHIILQDAGW